MWANLTIPAACKDSPCIILLGKTACNRADEAIHKKEIWICPKYYYLQQASFCFGGHITLP